MEQNKQELNLIHHRLNRLEDMRVKHEESLDTISSRLQVLENSKFNAHLTEEKLLQLESFAGVLERKINNIESYRDFKEKRYEELKEKIFQIIGILFFASGCFLLGVVSGGIQWK